LSNLFNEININFLISKIVRLHMSDPLVYEMF
jgi:hypothetical protein